MNSRKAHDDATWPRWVDTELRSIQEQGRWRAPQDFDAAGPSGTRTFDGRDMVSFASNDYLGLGHHPAVIAAAHIALDRWGAGAGAARLIVGSRPIHSALEAALASWKNADQAVLFPTGFAANLGTITTFAGPDTLVISDELNHASIVDACRLSKAEVAVYPHVDLGRVEALLTRSNRRRVIVVTDSVFSMDGDSAPVNELAVLCERYGALLILDEAHAVLGPALAPTQASIIRVGTLSKMLGSLGGFAATDRAKAELIVNRARSYIFTTASSPADVAAAYAALTIVESPEGEALRNRLRGHIERVRPGHRSPIIPVLLGDEQRALAFSRMLENRGLLVPAIRPPTVAAGTSRLRIALSASHTDEQVGALIDALHELDALGERGTDA